MRRARGATTQTSDRIGPALGFALVAAAALVPDASLALPLGAEAQAADGPTPAPTAADGGQARGGVGPLTFSLEPMSRPTVFFDMNQWRDGAAERMGLGGPGFGLAPIEDMSTDMDTDGADAPAPEPAPPAPNAGAAFSARDAALPLVGLGLTLLALVARRWRR
ncbi:MAG: hypothetical protein VYD87_20955 [Pseudomonadota bacterium]|nr:hypothetical protein [Pseudomonadota bacterium]MEE3099618.1 hypothetical protein [Pseudomonadota bacterium]